MKRPTDREEEQAWIERYALGKMPPEEMRFFENELVNDPDLTHKMNEIKTLHRVMQEAFLQEQALETLRKLQSRSRIKRRSVTMVRYIGFAAAACVAFMAYLSFSMPRFPDSENDFTVVRSTNKTTMPPAQRQVFDQFFEGQAHIVEGQYVMAVKNFETVLESNDLRPYFKEAAQWHLIVAYLKSGDLSRAEILYKRFDNCLECEYHVSTLNRWKIWWQINVQKLTS
ncbi:hypothetical protein SAMN05216327_10243 [Dyadobacter sp. SG02]|uniref:hypothetical protein n=1 Tax=Dyadobacter sp. SG02 TaxID=1855291 RepID=UPI0008CFB31F|nr:hypothetical protein [Dyadobacter sp. SG02]SEI49811.1 hypothetical protein SAMN05216327_10243 [Dyadobacter sp. SG02]